MPIYSYYNLGYGPDLDLQGQTKVPLPPGGVLYVPPPPPPFVTPVPV